MKSLKISLLLSIFGLLLLPACSNSTTRESLEQDILPDKAEQIDMNISLPQGLLEIHGDPTQAGVNIHAESKSQQQFPGIEYRENGKKGQLDILRQKESREVDASQWVISVDPHLPVYLDLDVGPGMANLFLSSMSTSGFDIQSKNNLLGLNLTGYWSEPVQGKVTAEKGRVSIMVPASVPVSINLHGEPEKVESGDMQLVDGVYLNDAAKSKEPVLQIELEAHQSEVAFSVGYPGDKQIKDFLITAQVLFAQDKAYRCSEVEDDGQKPDDTVGDLWYDYLCEYGPSHRDFTADDQLTLELAQSLLLQEIRSAYYTGEEVNIEDQLSFGAEAFLGATVDMMIKMQGIQDPDFSITHFLGSFDYTIEPQGDRLLFTITNQTDRASGTRVPFRYIESGYETSLEELVEADPDFADAYLLEVLMTERYPILSILEAKTRQETSGGEGGGIFTQTFTWSEKRFTNEEFENLEHPISNEQLDIR